MPNAGGPFFGAKLTAWRHKIFHIFHFLQSDMDLKLHAPFCAYLMPFPVRKEA